MGNYLFMRLADGFLESMTERNIRLKNLYPLIPVNIYPNQRKRKREYQSSRNPQSPSIPKDLMMPTGGIEAAQNEKSDALMKVAGRGCSKLMSKMRAQNGKSLL